MSRCRPLPPFHQTEVLNSDDCAHHKACGPMFSTKRYTWVSESFRQPAAPNGAARRVSTHTPQERDSFGYNAGGGRARAKHARTRGAAPLPEAVFPRTGNSCCFKGGGTGRVRAQRLTAGEEPGPLPGGGTRRVSLSYRLGPEPVSQLGAAAA